MKAILHAVSFGASLALLGCSLPEGARGASCERSAQCKAGLVCIEHECTSDLDEVAEQSTVPDLGGGSGMPADAASGDGEVLEGDAATDDDGG